MIRLRADAVLTVYDGYSGRPATQSTVRVFLDGVPFRPEYREGGYLVFINLEPGGHEIALKSAYYLDETISVETGPGCQAQRIVSLKPGQNYPFSGDTTRLCVTVRGKNKPVPGARVSLATVTGTEVKIAQDLTKKGDLELKLYVSGRRELRLPGEYLIVDGKNSEECTLGSVTDGTGFLAEPLTFEHKRGVAFCPCQRYITDENGSFTAILREPVTTHLFIKEKSKITSFDLAAGENHLDLDI